MKKYVFVEFGSRGEVDVFEEEIENVKEYCKESINGVIKDGVDEYVEEGGSDDIGEYMEGILEFVFFNELENEYGIKKGYSLGLSEELGYYIFERKDIVDYDEFYKWVVDKEIFDEI